MDYIKKEMTENEKRVMEKMWDVINKAKRDIGHGKLTLKAEIKVSDDCLVSGKMTMDKEIKL